MTETTFAAVDQSEVDRFAAAVRAALSDLSVEEVEDLTDGLEADLAERAADTDYRLVSARGSEQPSDLGDPLAYAEELRTAAGLPRRSTPVPSATSMGSILGQAAQDAGRAFRELYDHPVIKRLGDFFVALRPVWWLFRALAFFLVLTLLFRVPTRDLSLATVVLAVGSVIVSVQFGRGRWLPKRWMRRAMMTVNVLLVISIPLVLLAAGSLFGSQVSTAYAEGQSDSDSFATSSGLTYNGHQISNIFAYDAAGNPLTNVQLFTQSGAPLNTVSRPNSTTVTDGDYLVPSSTVAGRHGWNVYPLLRVPSRELNDSGLPSATSVPVAVKPPFLTVQPLASELAASPTSTATPSATATATPAPGATPTATPTPTPSPKKKG